jgi:hypothetical protein
MDVDDFIRDGYVAIRGAVDPDTAAACREAIWATIASRGVDRHDPATWPAVISIDCPEGGPFVTAGTSPALAAACDELIGPGRWTRRQGVGGQVVVRFPNEHDRANCGYHIEGSYTNPEAPGRYRVNVRSRARGLLALFLFSDVELDDAPTRLVVGSHLYPPEFLAPYGDAGTDAEAQFWRWSVLCRPMAHATGHAGDVYLCHPFIVHTATWPHRGRTPRMVAQPAVHVREGFALDGSDPSPVARAIVTGLDLARANGAA